jgi:hypothetical protein
MVEGECRNRLALPVYGATPSAGVCAECEFRGGFRGLGDVAAWAISFLPAGRRAQARGCAGCHRRQEAMNAAVPFPEKRKCTTCRKSGQAPLTSEPMSNTTPPHE